MKSKPIDQVLEAIDRPLQRRELGHRGGGDADLGGFVAGAVRGERAGRGGESEEQGRENMCAFCKQAAHRGGICGIDG